MKTTTYKAVTEKNSLMKFVELAPISRELKVNEYYALMVEDDDYPRNNSPHVEGIDVYTHRALVGVEKTSSKEPNEGVYISKNHTKRKDSYRGSSIIVEVAPNDKDKFCEL